MPDSSSTPFAHCARCGYRTPVSLSAWIGEGETLSHCDQLMQLIGSLADIEEAINDALEHESPATVTARLVGGVVTPGESPE